jgi:Dolichyl-phosphate-mannose-protein mannosyltransferase
MRSAVSLETMRWLLILLAIVVATLAVGSMWEDSATADEAAHIAAGLLKAREGRLDIYATQAPLMEALIAVPLVVTGYRVPDAWRQYGNRPWVAGHLLLYRAGYDAQRILRLARLPVIALFLALCFAVYWFVREITGSGPAALAAFALTGFCPTLLAHGRLATVDMGVTFFAFLATALLLRLLRNPSRGVAVATGIALACALATKVSGALLVPFFLIVIVLWFVRQRNLPSALWIAALTSIVAFMAIYLLLARSADLTLPFRAYLSEVRAVREFYVSNPLPQFLLGEFSQKGWPHYYLVAMAVKTPLAALALLVLGVVRTRRFEAIVCVVFVALFLLVSAFSSLNLGIRHVLPIYPFLYAACAISLSDASRNLRMAAGVLVAAHALTAVFAYPSYLSYFNPLIGSPRNADRVLIDSNLDWGQDLRRLGRWARANDVDNLRVHYFGAGNVEYELGGRAIRWPAPRPEPLPQGWFAVSRHFYRLSFLSARSRVDYDAYLRASGARYVTTIGGSIDVYRVP